MVTDRDRQRARLAKVADEIGICGAAVNRPLDVRVRFSFGQTSLQNELRARQGARVRRCGRRVAIETVARLLQYRHLIRWHFVRRSFVGSSLRRDLEAVAHRRFLVVTIPPRSRPRRTGRRRRAKQTGADLRHRRRAVQPLDFSLEVRSGITRSRRDVAVDRRLRRDNVTGQQL